MAVMQQMTATQQAMLERLAPQAPIQGPPVATQARAYNTVVQGPAPAQPAPTAKPQTTLVVQPTMSVGGSSTATTSSKKPPMGESGSGYTRLANGKLVKNKRPKERKLQERQARNWRSNATTALVQWLKEAGISREDPKPEHDPVYLQLVEDLENAKSYMDYVNNDETPLDVTAWKRENFSVQESSPAGKAVEPVSGPNTELSASLLGRLGFGSFPKGEDSSPAAKYGGPLNQVAYGRDGRLIVGWDESPAYVSLVLSPGLVAPEEIPQDVLRKESKAIRAWVLAHASTQSWCDEVEDAESAIQAEKSAILKSPRAASIEASATSVAPIRGMTPPHMRKPSGQQGSSPSIRQSGYGPSSGPETAMQ